MNEQIKMVSWAALKAIIDQREFPYQHFEADSCYDVIVSDGQVVYKYRIQKSDEPDAEQIDYEANYKDDAGESLNGPENPTNVQVGINKKRDKTVAGNNIDCPHNGWIALCSLTVGAGRNVLVEEVIVTMLVETVTKVRIRNTTAGTNKRMYFMGRHLNNLHDRVFLRNESSGSSKTYELQVRQSSGSPVTMSGVMVARRTK